MPQTRKVKFDKAAWAWSDNVDPEEISEENINCAYRLNLPKCKVGCKRNCRGNPFCLSGLGESRWLDNIQDESEDDDQDLDIREPNSFVGLKNLGATCYVNSLLQLWFHNLAFRRAIFCWNPLEDSVESLTLQDDSEILIPPQTVVGHLQILFALMQFGKKKSVDPSEFIKVLDLEPSTQQDAQEFSKLFISLLEDSLGEQSDTSVRNLISNNFRGEYSYITRCSNCQKESVSPSLFYELELNVKGNKTLHESITEFLKEEKLDGANMYSCGNCQEKHEASRFIRLQNLPPVLNLQLMRFIYDRQKGHKKKINSSIQFPDTLDMSCYMSGAGAGERIPLIYNLTAVLIHKGPSAYSGHYVAHICDQITGTWYKFNDECVEKMEGKKLKLGSEDDSEDGRTKAKLPRLGKSMLASSNAYMLVYTVATSDESKQLITETVLTPYLKKQVDTFNSNFDDFVSKAKEEKKNRKMNGKVHKAEMASLLLSLPVLQNDEWEAINTKWLCYWLGNKKPDIDIVDNSKLLCSHSKLDPNALNDTKYINPQAANTIFEKYNGGPRLFSNTALCKECVIWKCRGIQKRNQISEDAKEISNLLKQKDNLEGLSFWVGKSSLKSWKRKAIRLLVEKEEEELMKSTNPFGPHNRELMDTSEISNEDAAQLGELPSSPSSYTLDQNKDSDPSSSNNVCSKFNDVDERDRRKDIDSPIMLIDSVIRVANIIKAKLNFIYNCDNNKELSKDSVEEELKSLHNEWMSFGHHIQDLYQKMKNCKDFKEGEDIKYDTPMETAEATINQVVNGNYYTTVITSNDELKHRKKRKFEDDDDESGDEGRTNGIGNKSDDEEEDEEEEFNADIVCTHGNMVHEETSRKLISENIWNILRKYFTEAREFAQDTEPCHQCACLASEGQVAKDLYKQQAQVQKELLQDLLLGRNRPKQVPGTFHLVSVPDFLDPWRRFIKEAGRREPLYSVRNSTLICPHGLLIYNPDLEGDSSKVALITEEEWTILSGLYAVDQQITVSWDATGEMVTDPAVCGECLMERLEREQRALLEYSRAKLYIRPISNNKTGLDDKSERLQPEGPPSPTTSTEGKGLKRMRTEPEVVRRSTRHRKVRGEKEVTMSSSQTLKDLKLQILYACGVFPYDQHLTTEDGRELVDNAATLSSLHIYPNSVIFLKIDEPTKGTSNAVEDFIRSPEPEAGFKGTGLMKRL